MKNLSFSILFLLLITQSTLADFPSINSPNLVKAGKFIAIMLGTGAITAGIKEAKDKYDQKKIAKQYADLQKAQKAANQNSSEIDKLEKKIAALQNEINKLNSEKQSLKENNNNLSEKSQEVDSLRDQMHALNNELERQKAEALNAQQEKEALENQINNDKETIAQKQQEMSQLENQARKNQNDINSLNNKNDQIKTQLNGAQQSLSNISNQLANEKNLRAQEKAQLNQEKNNLEQRIAALNDDHVNNQQTIDNLANGNQQLTNQLNNATQEIDNLQNQAQSAQSEIANLKNKIDEYEDSQSESIAEIRDLAFKQSAQERELDDLTQKLNRANDEKRQAEQALEDDFLANANDKMKKDRRFQEALNEREQQINDMEQQLDDHQQKVNKLQNEAQEMHADKKALKGEITQANANLAIAESQLRHQKSQHEIETTKLNDAIDKELQKLERVSATTKELNKKSREAQLEVFNKEQEIKDLQNKLDTNTKNIQVYENTLEKMVKKTEKMEKNLGDLQKSYEQQGREHLENYYNQEKAFANKEQAMIDELSRVQNQAADHQSAYKNMKASHDQLLNKGIEQAMKDELSRVKNQADDHQSAYKNMKASHDHLLNKGIEQTKAISKLHWQVENLKELHENDNVTKKEFERQLEDINTQLAEQRRENSSLINAINKENENSRITTQQLQEKDKLNEAYATKNLDLLSRLTKQEVREKGIKKERDDISALLQGTKQELDDIKNTRVLIHRRNKSPVKIGKVNKEAVPQQFPNPNFTNTQ